MMEYVLQIAAAHGASHADVLTVAAAKCTTEVLGGTVDIASHCEAAGFPLRVRPLSSSTLCTHLSLIHI